MPQPTLVIGSRNKKKIGELEDLLRPHEIAVRSVSEFDNVADVIEDGDSFAANAAKKACETANAIGHWVMGEDSGLCVNALKGAPGIYSARYSGENATDDQNNSKLIAELANVPESKRAAHYVCSVAIANPQGEVCLAVEGQCHGVIATAPRGTNGFGYDPYFLIPEYHKTFGELGPIVKQCLSHRSRALAQLIPALVRELRKADSAPSG